MYIGREDEKNILSYLDLTILRNVISQFPKLSINIFKDVINFSISYSARAFKWRKMFSLILRNILTKLIQADMVTTQLLIVCFVKKSKEQAI